MKKEKERIKCKNKLNFHVVHEMVCVYIITMTDSKIIIDRYPSQILIFKFAKWFVLDRRYKYAIFYICWVTLTITVLKRYSVYEWSYGVPFLKFFVQMVFF